jgi:hypothetical protein
MRAKLEEAAARLQQVLMGEGVTEDTICLALNTARGQHMQLHDQDRIEMSTASCHTTPVPSHIGWHLNASASSITLTDN